MVSLEMVQLETQIEKWARIKKDISNWLLVQEAASMRELILFKKEMRLLTSIWNHLVTLRMQGSIQIKI